MIRRTVGTGGDGRWGGREPWMVDVLADVVDGEFIGGTGPRVQRTPIPTGTVRAMPCTPAGAFR